MKKRIIIGLCVAVLLSGAAWWSIKSQNIRVPVSMLLQPPEMVAAQYSNKNVVGDLGGVPVTIPKHFAEYVECDGDPGFGEKRPEIPPVRTHDSKLRSFGFEVRYPDMVGMSTPALREEKRKQNIYKTMWLNVGIHTGSQYKGEGTLDRLAYGRLEILDTTNTLRNYDLLTEKQHGLTVYAQTKIDPKTNRQYREGVDGEDVFVRRDENGKVTVFIICSNRKIESAPCQQWIDLEPHMKADVYISYRRGILSEWMGIQEKVSQLIYRFEVKK